MKETQHELTGQSIQTVTYDKRAIANVIESLNRIQFTGINQAQSLVTMFQLLNHPIKESDEVISTESN